MTREPRQETAASLYARQARALDVHGEHWSGPPELVDAVAALARTKHGDHVLDVACGVGGPARRLTALVGCRVVATDASACVVARARSLSDDSSIPFVVASAEDLPFAAASFDQVWCLGALAHFERPRRFFREAARVLRSGGLVALSEGLREPGATLRFEPHAPTPWRPPHTDEVRADLVTAGFDDIRLLPWPPTLASSLARVREKVLRDDLVAGRLRPHLVVARHTARARMTSAPEAPLNGAPS